MTFYTQVNDVFALALSTAGPSLRHESLVELVVQIAGEFDRGITVDNPATSADYLLEMGLRTLSSDHSLLEFMLGTYWEHCIFLCLMYTSVISLKLIKKDHYLNIE